MVYSTIIVNKPILNSKKLNRWKTYGAPKGAGPTQHVFSQLTKLGIDRETYQLVVVNQFLSEYPETEFKNLATKVVYPYPSGQPPLPPLLTFPPLPTPRLNKAGRPIVNLRRGAMANQPMASNPVILSCICGTVFSDASLTKNGHNYRIGTRLSTRHTEWFMWKALYVCKAYLKTSSSNVVYPKTLWEGKPNYSVPSGVPWRSGPFAGNPGSAAYHSKLVDYVKKTVDPTGLALNQKRVNSISLVIPDGHQAKSKLRPGEFLLGKWHLQTLNHSDLTALHPLLYKGKKKIIKRSWLNHMNNFFLMTLWLDDGWLLGHRQGRICWNNTTLAEAQIFVQYLKAVWNIKCHAFVNSKKSHLVEIHIDDLANLEKWCSIIAPIIPVKSLLYKVCIYAISSSSRQRWTSKLKTLIRPDWLPEIDLIYAQYDAEAAVREKKKQLKKLLKKRGSFGFLLVKDVFSKDVFSKGFKGFKGFKNVRSQGAAFFCIPLNVAKQQQKKQIVKDFFFCDPATIYLRIFPKGRRI